MAMVSPIASPELPVNTNYTIQPGAGPIQSQIKAFQTRCISLFPDGSGFAIGNIEGRVAIHYIDHKQGEYVYIIETYMIVFFYIYSSSMLPAAWHRH